MKRVKLVPHDSTDSRDSRESIEMDEFSDEDDDVFLRNNRNGDSRDSSARRPLMKKKRRKQNGDFHATIRTSKPKYRRCCGPLCWMFLAFKTLIGLLIVTILLVNYFTHTSWYFWHWNSDALRPAPCHGLEVIPVWSRNFPKRSSDGNVKMLNISKDDVLDVVVGFGTGADGYVVPELVCDIYFSGQKPCFGGVMALDGRTGDVLWTRWTDHEVFALTCQGDLNGDNTTDCVAGGRGGLLIAVSGLDGKELWQFDKDHLIQTDLMSVYAVQFVHDLNGDGRPDILAVHGGNELSDPALEKDMFGRLILFDGIDGSVLQWMQTPDHRESYYPPQILHGLDGEQSVLFGTGGNTRGGGLYVIKLIDLYKRKLSRAVQIYRDDSKGMLTPASLADLTGDGVEDIIVATFSGLVLAFNGASYLPLWNTSFADSETYSSVALGHFDEDQVPDVLVKYQHGKRGYPVYEYDQAVVLSGKTGAKISFEFTDSIGSQSSPLTLSVKGKGNDIFLHWTSHCRGHEKEKLNYDFPDYVGLHDQRRADVCQSLFRTNQVTQYASLQRFGHNSSTRIYYSADYADVEHTNVTNTSAMADLYAKQHPNVVEAFERAEEDSEEGDEDGYSVLPYSKNDLNRAMWLLRKEIENIFDQDEEGNIYAVEDGGGGEGDDADADEMTADADMDAIGDADPRNLAYVEGEDMPVRIPPAKKTPPSALRTSERVQDMVYNQPHSVNKYPNELGGQVDNFEYPYQYPQSQQPQQQQQQRMYPNAGFGRRRSRRKRQAADADSAADAAGKAADNGRHKYWAIHPMSSTGTLAPSMLSAPDSMDLVLSTYWIYPAKVPVLQSEDIKCVEKEMKKAANSASSSSSDSAFDEDDDSLSILGQQIVTACLKSSGHLPPADETYETPSDDYNPFALNMGQLTVHRFTLRCKCRTEWLESDQKCGQLWPYEQQGWPAYMGWSGDARFRDAAKGDGVGR